MALARTPDEFLSTAARHIATAKLCIQRVETSASAWEHAGLAVELVLKAAIMAKERLNTWPEREQRRDLYVHNLRSLAEILGIEIAPEDPIAPIWAIVQAWRREDSYADGLMHRKSAVDLCEAAYGDDGVVRWICEKYLMNYSLPEEVSSQPFANSA